MLSANAQKVLEKRYLLRDEEGRLVESAEGLFRRVAAAVAGIEKKWGAGPEEVARVGERFFSLMAEGRFMPNSPTLMNAGKVNGQLSACFVLPVPDNLEGIFETCKNAALIHKTGGGTGFSFSRIRPVNDRVATTTGVASGPVSFMTVYDAATEAIRQGGTRRGANMGILNVDHPDIEEFICCKRDLGKLNNFNISVAVTEKFMRAVDEDLDFELVHPRTGKVVKVVRARMLFDLMVESAHRSAEPGLIFLDRINDSDPMIETMEADAPVPGTENIEATNPCGEQPLGPGDACNLGSLNLSLFVRADGSDFDWDALASAVEVGHRFLDDIVESNHYPLPFIARAALGNRRVGLGVMGWAEALILLAIPYDSDEAVAMARKVMSFIQDKAHEASGRLAITRGNFPNWPFSTWGQRGIPMRNATVTTIAPTGTISIIAGTSSGIEPLFAVSFVRRVLGGTELTEVNPLFEKVAKDRGFYSDDLMRLVAEEGSIQQIESIPEDVKRVWRCAHDIAYTWHVAMQAAFQDHTDCAVSKTVNFPVDATVDDIRAAYMAAYKMGLKGLTVYRDTSRSSQVLNIGKTDPLKKVDSAGLPGTVTSPQFKRAPRNGEASANRSGAGGRVTSLRIIMSPGEDKFTKPERGRAVSNLARFRGRPRAGCPECGSESDSMIRYEACGMCPSCGYTRC